MKLSRKQALDCIKACQMVGTYDFADDVLIALAVYLVLRVMEEGI